jgi:hypothetical protein
VPAVPPVPAVASAPPAPVVPALPVVSPLPALPELPAVPVDVFGPGPEDEQAAWRPTNEIEISKRRVMYTIAPVYLRRPPFLLTFRSGDGWHRSSPSP